MVKLVLIKWGTFRPPLAFSSQKSKNEEDDEDDGECYFFLFHSYLLFKFSRNVKDSFVQG